MIDLLLTIIRGQAAALVLAKALIEEQAEALAMTEEDIDALLDDIQAIEDLMDGLVSKAGVRGWTS